MDRIRRWTTADGDPGWMTGDGSRPEMDRDRQWIATGYGWMTGDGSREMDQGRRMTINLFSNMKLRSYNRARICRHTVFQQHASTEYDAKHYSEHYSQHYSEIPNRAPTCPSSNAEYDPESYPELQLQCRYRTSRTRLIFGGATIFKEGDDSAGFATTLNASNYRTGSAFINREG
jgi:hypothetical protein